MDEENKIYNQGDLANEDMLERKKKEAESTYNQAAGVKDDNEEMPAAQTDAGDYDFSEFDVDYDQRQATFNNNAAAIKKAAEAQAQKEREQYEEQQRQQYEQQMRQATEQGVSNMGTNEKKVIGMPAGSEQRQDDANLDESVLLPEVTVAYDKNTGETTGSAAGVNMRDIPEEKPNLRYDYSQAPTARDVGRAVEMAFRKKTGGHTALKAWEKEKSIDPTGKELSSIERDHEMNSLLAKAADIDRKFASAKPGSDERAHYLGLYKAIDHQMRATEFGFRNYSEMESMPGMKAFRMNAEERRKVSPNFASLEQIIDNGGDLEVWNPVNPLDFPESVRKKMDEDKAAGKELPMNFYLNLALKHKDYEDKVKDWSLLYARQADITWTEATQQALETFDRESEQLKEGVAKELADQWWSPVTGILDSSVGKGEMLLMRLAGYDKEMDNLQETLDRSTRYSGSGKNAVRGLLQFAPDLVLLAVTDGTAAGVTKGISSLISLTPKAAAAVKGGLGFMLYEAASTTIDAWGRGNPAETGQVIGNAAKGFLLGSGSAIIEHGIKTGLAPKVKGRIGGYAVRGVSGVSKVGTFASAEVAMELLQGKDLKDIDYKTILLNNGALIFTMDIAHNLGKLNKAFGLKRDVSRDVIQKCRNMGYNTLADELVKHNNLSFAGSEPTGFSEAARGELRALTEAMRPGGDMTWEEYTEVLRPTGQAMTEPGTFGVDIISDKRGVRLVTLDSQGIPIREIPQKSMSEAKKNQAKMQKKIDFDMERANEEVFDQQRDAQILAMTARKVADTINAESGKKAFNEDGTPNPEYDGYTAKQVLEAFKAIQDKHPSERTESEEYILQRFLETMETVRGEAMGRDAVKAKICEYFGVSEEAFDKMWKTSPENRSGKEAQACAAYNAALMRGYEVTAGEPVAEAYLQNGDKVSLLNRVQLGEDGTASNPDQSVFYRDSNGNTHWTTAKSLNAVKEIEGGGEAADKVSEQNLQTKFEQVKADNAERLQEFDDERLEWEAQTLARSIELGQDKDGTDAIALRFVKEEQVRRAQERARAEYEGMTQAQKAAGFVESRFSRKSEEEKAALTQYYTEHPVEYEEALSYPTVHAREIAELLKSLGVRNSTEWRRMYDEFNADDATFREAYRKKFKEDPTRAPRGYEKTVEKEPAEVRAAEDEGTVLTVDTEGNVVEKGDEEGTVLKVDDEGNLIDNEPAAPAEGPKPENDMQPAKVETGEPIAPTKEMVDLAKELYPDATEEEQLIYATEYANDKASFEQAQRDLENQRKREGKGKRVDKLLDAMGVQGKERDELREEFMNDEESLAMQEEQFGLSKPKGTGAQGGNGEPAPVEEGSMPMKGVNGKQRPDYGKATAEQTHKYLSEKYSDKEREDFITNQRADKDKILREKEEALAAAKKAEEEGPKTRLSEETEDQYDAEKAQLAEATRKAQEEYDAAKADLEKWDKVKGLNEEGDKAKAEEPKKEEPKKEEPKKEEPAKSAPEPEQREHGIKKDELEEWKKFAEKSDNADLVARVEEAARKMGVTIKLYDGKDPNENGYTEDGVIYVNRNAGDKEKFSFVFGHEFAHNMQDAAEGKNSNTYKAFKKAAIDKKRAELGDEGYEALVSEKMEDYKDKISEEVYKKAIKNGSSVKEAAYLADEAAKIVDRAYVEDEIAADVAGRMLEKPDAFKEMFRDTSDMNILRRAYETIRDWYNRMIAAAKGDDEKKHLMEVRDRFNEMYNELTRENAANEKIMQDVADKLGSGFEGKGKKYSTTSIIKGSGFDIVEDDGRGNVAITIDGKTFDYENPVTADDVARRDSPLTFMMDDARSMGLLSRGQERVIYDKYASLLNLYLYLGQESKGGLGNLQDTFTWLGHTVLRSIKSNGDKQYSYSNDIMSICKKNEAVINAISARQLELNRGLTPSEIIDLYRATDSFGYQVPCPVCYVFSRYIRNGKYASAAINGMLKYGEHLPGGGGVEWTAKDWADELMRLTREQKSDQKYFGDSEEEKALKKKAAAFETALKNANEVVTYYEENIDSRVNKIAKMLTGEKKLSPKEEAKLRKELEVMDKEYVEAVKLISQGSLTNWIKSFAIKQKGEDWVMREDAGVPENWEEFKSHALDLRKTPETIEKYPGIQRLRKSGGSAGGKEITQESNNEVGEVAMGLGLSNDKLNQYSNYYKEAAEATDPAQREALRKKARERFAKAASYVAKQNLRGGQRFWSWSDNLERLSPDIALNLMSMEMLGGGVQTYSKQLEGVELMASMGAYVNGSLMAKDNGVYEVRPDNIEVVNGVKVLKTPFKETVAEIDPDTGKRVERERILAEAGSPIYEHKGKAYVAVFDDIIGIAGTGRNGKLGLFDLNRQYDRAGNIIVGMNDLHVRTVLSDPRIFFCIPWHSSGAHNHILNQMLEILGTDMRGLEKTDYTSMQEEKNFAKKNDKGELPKIPDRLKTLWGEYEKIAEDNGWACGTGKIDHNQDYISDSQRHYRALRDAIFDGTVKEGTREYEEIMGDVFLKQVYDAVQKAGGKMTTDDKGYIYPYEYWDKSSTYGKKGVPDTADINGARYIEYCRRLGFSPKFSGNWKAAKNWNVGNFVNDKGYWKLLIDRRMYDRNGDYQEMSPIDSSGFSPDLVNPAKVAERHHVTQVADAEGTAKIVAKAGEMRGDRAPSYTDEDYKIDPVKAAEAFREASAARKKVRKQLIPTKPKVTKRMSLGGKTRVEDMAEEVVGREGERRGVVNPADVRDNKPGVESRVRFSLRTKEPPKNTKKVYKLMRLGEDGKLYPLFIDSTDPIELGKWYDADSPNLDMLKEMPDGVHLVNPETGESTTLEDYCKERGIKVGKYPPKSAVEEATANGMRWVYIEPTERGQKRFGGENRKYWNIGINGSDTVSTFSMRPGWHAGSLPTMRQIGKGAGKNLRDDRFVWVEGEISADVDYNEEAQRNPDKDIPTHIPTDGFYMKATNANAKASQADRVGWYISGAFKPNRLISDREARAIIDEWNNTHPNEKVEYDFPRESGKEFNAETMSLEEVTEGESGSPNIRKRHSLGGGERYSISQGDYSSRLRELFRRRRNGEDVTAELQALNDEWRNDAQNAAADFTARETQEAENRGIRRSEQLAQAAENKAAKEEDRVPVEVPKADLPLTGYETPQTAIGLAQEAQMRAVVRGEGSREQRRSAIRGLAATMSNLHKAMREQREYDKQTVGEVVNFAKTCADLGLLDNATLGEVKKVMTAIKDATGAEDLHDSTTRLLDVVLNAQARNIKDTIKSLLNTPAAKIGAKGVVEGKMDVSGQYAMKELNSFMGSSESKINAERTWLQNQRDKAERDIREGDMREKARAQRDLEKIKAQQIAIEIAKNYMDRLTPSEDNIRVLEKELEDLKQDYKDGLVRGKEYREEKHLLENMLREERVDKLHSLWDSVNDIRTVIEEGVAGGKTFAERQQKHAEDVIHDANKDLEGVSTDTQERPGSLAKAANNAIVSGASASLYTLDTMLRALGSRSINGEGFLFNRFGRGWLECRDNEIEGFWANREALDGKARELFGVKKFSDLIGKARGMKKIKVTYKDGANMKEHDFDQAQALYVYMVNKMDDGKMKLRRMGISEEDVENIKNQLDKRFVKLADWLQSDFLAKKHAEYNEVHMRMFGAPLTHIKDYVPLRIDPRRRAREVDISADNENDRMSTTTSGVIERTRNTQPLDLLNTNAIDLVLDHLVEMNHWQHFAEWNRDVNTLLSDTTFRNKIENSKTMYGSGEQLWNRLNQVFQLAGGVYKPKSGDFDKAVVNIAQGVSAAKVSFRAFTAAKQLLSLPVFATECDPHLLLKNVAELFSPKKGEGKVQNSFFWCMQNLPSFKERWRGRMAGDTRLESTELDWSFTKNKIVQWAAKWGLTPNAFIDACTVAAGAKSVYETKYNRYLKQGFSEEMADKRAKQDATIAFNQSQQSSEKMFVAPMQVDRTIGAAGATLFRNASMGYERKLVSGLKDSAKFLADLPSGGKERRAFMERQYREMGLTEAQAKKAAMSTWIRHGIKSLLNIGMYGFVAQACWNIGGKLPYLMFGDNGDEKRKILKEEMWHAALGGWLEGLPFGDNVSNGINNWWNGKPYMTFDPALLPIQSDIMNILKKFDKDFAGGEKTVPETWSAVTDVINLGVQAGIGVNPETFTNILAGIVDWAWHDKNLMASFDTAKEALLFALRFVNTPQTQLDQMYIDEIGMTGAEAKKLSPEKLAKRYAFYKTHQSTITAWHLYDKEQQDKIIDKYSGNMLKKMRGGIKENGGSPEDYLDYLENVETKKEHKTAQNSYVEALAKQGPQALREAWEKEKAKGEKADYKLIRALMSKWQQKVYGEEKMPTSAEEAYEAEHEWDISKTAEKVGRDLGFDYQDTFFQLSQKKTKTSSKKNKVVKEFGELGGKFVFTKDKKALSLQEGGLDYPVRDKAKMAKCLKFIKEHGEELTDVYITRWCYNRVGTFYDKIDEVLADKELNKEERHSKLKPYYEEIVRALMYGKDYLQKKEGKQKK